jgi:molybdopterin-containing oxidoreductase family membrane subunit
MVALAVGGTHELLVRDALVSGPFAFNFWVMEAGLGMILPFALILWSRGKRIGPIFLASALVIFSSFFMRFDMVVAGQIVPLYWELGVREYSKLHAYSPTWHEILVVLAGVGLTGAAFLLGEKVFQGFREVQGVGAPSAGKLEDVVQEPQSASNGEVDG